MVNDTSLLGLRHRLARDVKPGQCDEAGVRRLWWGALEVIQKALMQRDVHTGLWMAAPLPALYEPDLLRQLKGWVWAPESLERLSPLHAALPGSGRPASESAGFCRLALEPRDGDDPLLLVITPQLQLALAIHGKPGERQLLMRCDAESLSDALTMVGERFKGTGSELADQLRDQLTGLGPLRNDPDFDRCFWPRLAEKLTETAPSLTLQSLPDTSNAHAQQTPTHDLSLLEAMTHEVRTPLATIRTLIRSLLRRKDLPSVVENRLQQIDVECSEQIDRFGLIFQAAELQRKPSEMQLARTDLGAILQTLEPGWRELLDRRGVALQLGIENELPEILSDARRLEPMLGGLIDRVSRGLPPGSRLLLLLQPAGARLKLQLQVRSQASSTAADDAADIELIDTDLVDTEPVDKEQVGTVLSWDPSTGSLQLSQDATRQLMASLGGRYQARRKRDLTVFFPVASAHA